jgi:hypothetical protein
VLKVITKALLPEEMEEILFTCNRLDCIILVVLPVQKYYFYFNKKTK